MTRRRHYTAEDRAAVRALYPTATAADIAERIGLPRRGAKAVHQLAYRLGLTKWPRLPAEVIRRVSRLHAKGLTDADIARRTKLDRRLVTSVRRRLGLPLNRAAIHAAQLRAVASQRRTLGIRHGGDLRALAYRKYAAANGWPADLRPREVQILNVLAVHGPQTLLELATRLGMATDRRNSVHGGPKFLNSCRGSGGSYTASLLRRGLIAAERRYTRGRPQGKNQLPTLYYLAAAAAAIIHERIDHERTDQRPRDQTG